MKNNEKVVVHYVNLTNPLSFQAWLPNIDQHTERKRVIRGTKYRNDNKLQSL